MAPTKASAPPYSKDEKVLCFHHEMLYEAKILEVQQAEDSSYQYKIHYKGWKNTWDDWVPQDRIRKFNDENRELKSQLIQQARANQKSAKPAKKIALKGGSDFSSARGSEERTGGSAALAGRGPARRARDYDMEHYMSIIRVAGAIDTLLDAQTQDAGQGVMEQYLVDIGLAWQRDRVVIPTVA